MTRKVAGFVIGLILVCTPLNLYAKVSSITLKALAEKSDAILLARIETVRSDNGIRIAYATPQRWLKGKTIANKIGFVAEPTWTCDVSAAVPGENVLLFLNRSKTQIVAHTRAGRTVVHVKTSPLYLIAHSGRGRMPMRSMYGKVYVSLHRGDIVLPAKIATVVDPACVSPGFHCSVILDRLLQALPARKAGK